jgi:hypothetical protein
MRNGVADQVWNPDPAPPAPAYPRMLVLRVCFRTRVS